VPTLAGEPFVEKPPVFFVTAALFAELFGGWLPLHDAARLASGFYVALTLLFAGLTARELYGLEAGEVMDAAPARPREDRIPAYGEAAVA